MALPDLHPSTAEQFATWTRRILACISLLVLEFVLFIYVLSGPPVWLGFVLSPFVALATWQTASRILTGNYFQLSFDPMVRTHGELANVLFSVGFSINLVWFLYHLYLWFPTR